MKKTLLTSAALSATLVGASFAGDADALDASFGAKESSFLDRFTFGSYGEIHSTFNKDGGTDIDPHRIVLFADFAFTDKLKLVTETELEHALRKKPGQSFTSQGVELKFEQAYLEYAAADDLTIKAGLFLVPAGRINEVHEPTTFFGVERPNVEKNIIPTTWTELGVGAVKTYDSGLQLDAFAHSGLDTRGGSIRDGRSKYGIDLFTVNSPGNRFRQNNDSWAVTTRAKYSAIDNLVLAGTLQYQSDLDSTASGNQDGVLTTAHAVYRKDGFQFVALASNWSIDVDNKADSQWGYYLEPSYTWDTAIGKVGVFGRYSQFEYAKLKDGGSHKETTEYSAGGNYWINENLVVKAEYFTTDTKDSKGSDESYNFGFGWYY